MIGTVADLTPPDDLVELKKNFYSAEAEAAAYAQSLKTEPRTGDDTEAAERAGWERVWAKQRDLALQIHAHPWLAAAENRYEADAAASKVARQGV